MLSRYPTYIYIDSKLINKTKYIKVINNYLCIESGEGS